MRPGARHACGEFVWVWAGDGSLLFMCVRKGLKGERFAVRKRRVVAFCEFVCVCVRVYVHVCVHVLCYVCALCVVCVCVLVSLWGPPPL